MRARRIAGARALAALRELDPARWREAIRHALASAGTIPDAALYLELGESTLRRWLSEEPELREGLDLPGPGRPSRTV